MWPAGRSLDLWSRTFLTHLILNVLSVKHSVWTVQFSASRTLALKRSTLKVLSRMLRVECTVSGMLRVECTVSGMLHVECTVSGMLRVECL